MALFELRTTLKDKCVLSVLEIHPLLSKFWNEISTVIFIKISILFSAHNYVRSLRKSLIDLAESGADIDILRERVGQCLYTLKQFYSNTNWVDLHGDTIIKEFGMFLTS